MNGMIEISFRIPNSTRDLNGALIEFVLQKNWKNAIFAKFNELQLITMKFIGNYEGQFINHNEETENYAKLGYLRESRMLTKLVVESKFLYIYIFTFLWSCYVSFKILLNYFSRVSYNIYLYLNYK